MWVFRCSAQFVNVRKSKHDPYFFIVPQTGEHLRTSINCITKELKSRFIASQNSSRNTTRMDPNPHSQLRSTRAKQCLQII